ncbi:hypothetical protein FRC06_011860 [Ceratobasidium sp. 370]|nr:hypothetical protein FRC06_011860 [Ceratobasidium sp. 370]
MPVPPLKRAAHERRELLGSSLTSSRLVSDRMRAWFGPNSRGRLFVMEFDPDWQGKGCPVMDWYEQQRQTSTRFQVIEHRKNLDGPFYHEFLLLKLTDGAVCRVERTGDGSRADALRYTGCISNDLIQWFSEDDYAKFSTSMPSNLVAEIDLGQEFDILDVLAVCYSIQNTQPCSVYTLQRYNCYFFCWTILASLTRRLWETTITGDAWDLAVNSAMDHWSNVLPEEAKKHLMLRIYTLLDPHNPRATMQFLNPLRSHLSSKIIDLSVVNQALGRTLWATSSESALCDGLGPMAGGVRQSMYADDGICGTRLRRAASVRHEGRLREISSNPRLADVYWDNMMRAYSRSLSAVSRAFSHQCQLMEVERPLPRIKLAQCSLFASLRSLVILFGGAPSTQGWDFEQMLARKTLSSKFICMRMDALVDRVKRLGRLTGDDRYERLFEQEFSVIGSQHGPSCLMAIYDALESRHMLHPSEAATVLPTWSDDEGFDRHISSFAAFALSPALPALLKPNEAQLQVKIAHQGKHSPATTSWSVDEFQKIYLRSLIHAHAKRVAAHQLAAAELVEADIQDAMAEVWKSMPKGFRGSKKRS